MEYSALLSHMDDLTRKESPYIGKAGQWGPISETTKFGRGGLVSSAKKWLGNLISH
jgi:hypothetical protein